MILRYYSKVWLVEATLVIWLWMTYDSSRHHVTVSKTASYQSIGAVWYHFISLVCTSVWLNYIGAGTHVYLASLNGPKPLCYHCFTVVPGSNTTLETFSCADVANTEVTVDKKCDFINVSFLSLYPLLHYLLSSGSCCFCRNDTFAVLIDSSAILVYKIALVIIVVCVWHFSDITCPDFALWTLYTGLF